MKPEIANHRTPKRTARFPHPHPCRPQVASQRACSNTWGNCPLPAAARRAITRDNSTSKSITTLCGNACGHRAKTVRVSSFSGIAGPLHRTGLRQRGPRCRRSRKGVGGQVWSPWRAKKVPCAGLKGCSSCIFGYSGFGHFCCGTFQNCIPYRERQGIVRENFEDHASLHRAGWANRSVAHPASYKLSRGVAMDWRQTTLVCRDGPGRPRGTCQ